jgi:23S rRNA (adenine2503-C2)-methyltransferase
VLKKNILNFTLAAWEKAVEEIKLPRFRATQVWDWIYNKRVFTFADMSNISLATKEELEKHFCIDLPLIDDKNVASSADGSQKFLLTTTDGAVIESMVMYANDRVTICLSSMVGCPLRCAFCATGTEIGFVRMLDACEIIGQLFAVEKYLKNKVTSIVFMGMGEPLLNLANTKIVLENLLSPNACAYSRNAITLSTAGIAPVIAPLINKYRIRLAVSLHFPTDAQRSQYMPVNCTHGLKELFTALKQVKLEGNDYITIEYIMLKDINDSLDHARALVKICSHIKVKFNLIPYNKIASFEGEPSSQKTIDAFTAFLLAKGFRVSMRHSRGTDISGGCGQFALKKDTHTIIDD